MNCSDTIRQRQSECRWSGTISGCLLRWRRLLLLAAAPACAQVLRYGDKQMGEPGDQLPRCPATRSRSTST